MSERDELQLRLRTTIVKMQLYGGRSSEIAAMLAELERTHVLIPRDGLRDRVFAACDGAIWAGRSSEVDTCTDAVMAILDPIARDAPAGEDAG